MMNITISMDYLKPSTIATMIADLLAHPNENAIAIGVLVEGLETIVGDEDAIEYVDEAGIVPSGNVVGLEVKLYE